MRIRNNRPVWKKAGDYRNIILFMILIFGLNSCIEPFMADTDEEPDLISIEGGLIKGASRQHLVISRTTSIDNPRLAPIRGCYASILDDEGNEYPYEEAVDGTYVLDLSDEEIVVGRQYRLRVVTSEGKEYLSDFETLNEEVPIDSLYYDIEQRVDDLSGEEYLGVQFYLDLKADENLTRYFRWKLTETYEYTSFGPITFYFMDKTHTPIYPDDMFAVYRCWHTGVVDGVYISNTVNLMENEKKNIHLNFVSARDERMRIKYSLLLNQYSISEGAYKYFEQNKIATEEGDGLYTRQPQQPITNICNTEDDEERVIGYFWISSMTSVRLFVPRIDALNVQRNFCAVEPYSDEDHGDGPFPMRIYVDEYGIWQTSSPYCFDCTQRGGTNVRPSFWE